MRQAIELIKLDDPLKRTFYETECIQGNWPVRELKRQIGSLDYERSGLSENKEKMAVRDLYIFEFLIRSFCFRAENPIGRTVNGWKSDTENSGMQAEMIVTRN